MPYQIAIERLGIIGALAAFDPHVAGTLPLDINRPDSDIDILCHAVDPDAIVSVLWERYRSLEHFSLHQWSASGRPIIARFSSDGWPFEIFASVERVRDQSGWRHFDIERRLLKLGGPEFRETIRALRADGLKTEPAFARALHLAGEPYQALLDLFSASDAELAGMLP